MAVTQMSIKEIESTYNIKIAQLTYIQRGRTVASIVNNGIIDRSHTTIKEWFDKCVRPRLPSTAKSTERLRTERVKVNSVWLNNLRLPSKEPCKRIETADFKETIEENFKVNIDCELVYNGKPTGYIYKTTKGTTVSSIDCTIECLAEARRVCSPCKSFRRLLQKLKRNEKQEGEENMKLSTIRGRIADPKCRWRDCGAPTFSDIAELNDHMSTHVPKLLNLPPQERLFICEWEGCKTTRPKRKTLITHIHKSHSGDDNDEKTLKITEDQARNAEKGVYARKWEKCTVDALQQAAGPGQIRRLRDAGFCLPSATTVAEERKFGVSQSGWSREIVQEMKAAFNVEKPSQGRHGIISFDEVKIKEGVVQDPHTGRLIGTCDTTPDVGTHILQFFWSSAFASFSFPLAFFITKTAKAEDLLLWFWQGVELLQECAFHVIGVIFDGSAGNRRFQENIMVDKQKRHLAINICSEELDDKIIIISDPPHLAKKLRSSLHKSGHDVNDHTRLMKQSGEEMLWAHIIECFKENRRVGWALSLLTSEAVYLNNFTKMRIPLMEQVFDERVAVQLRSLGHTSTASYITNCAALWSLLNQRTVVTVDKSDEYVQKLESILAYFLEWEQEVYGSAERSPAIELPPFTTMRDLKTCIRGMQALCQRAQILGCGVEPHRVNQNVVEHWFGHQRQACGSNRNMTAAAYSCNNVNLGTAQVIRKASYDTDCDRVKQRNRKKRKEE